jgi:isopenicillin N synthase-like dioxygenase
LLSRALELQDDYLWENVQSHGGSVGDGYYRHALFYPLPEEDRVRRKGVRMYGHTDYGITTLLFSIPITALQIWTTQGKWQPVRYNPGSLVVNLGEALEIISGGHFKATRHKVGCIADPSNSDTLMTCIPGQRHSEGSAALGAL